MPEPFEARITIDETQDVIRSGEIRYSDASVGLGANPVGEGGTRPENVTAWLYVFTRSRYAPVPSAPRDEAWANAATEFAGQGTAAARGGDGRVLAAAKCFVVGPRVPRQAWIMSTPIIAFSKDWHEAPTSNHHVLRELARSRRVVWLNSVATRTPQLSSSRDLGKIKRKLSEFVHGARNVENDLWVATPLVVPMPHSATANAINGQLLRWTVSALRARLGIDEFQLWSFLPNTAAYVGTLGEQLSVYYCVDEWATFGMLDRVATARAERRLLEKVDITFATSHALALAKRRTCPSTYLALHGVDHALFARALDAQTMLPPELAALPRPRIGFFGTLRDFLDYDLIAGIARARRSWSIVLVGPTRCDVTRLRGLKNIHLLGPRHHAQLPAFCKGFDVGLVPYRIDDAVKFINPLKLREYLSAGVPVVSTPMPEVLRYQNLCHIARSSDEAVAAIERAIAEDSLASREVRSAAMEREGWAERVEALVRTIEEATTLRKGARVAV